MSTMRQGVSAGMTRTLSNSSASLAPVASLKGRSLLSIADLSTQELKELLDLSSLLREAYRVERRQDLSPLTKRSMAMIFQKRSTRTRVSSETGMSLLGGHALFLGPQDIQLGVNETMRDTANVLARFNDVVLARVFGHNTVEELVEHSSVPVINALSDLHHPLQTLADLMTLRDHFGGDDALKGKSICWIGDGNNVLHDLMLGAAKLGMNVRVATPPGYEPNAGVLEKTRELADESGASVLLTTDPKEAAQTSSILVTDTFVSMGEEAEAAEKLRAFQGFQVNDELMAIAEDDAVFLHCLPRHPEEVTDSVFYSEQSLVFPEAENRMWTVMAVIWSLLGN